MWICVLWRKSRKVRLASCARRSHLSLPPLPLNYVNTFLSDVIGRSDGHHASFGHTFSITRLTVIPPRLRVHASTCFFETRVFHPPYLFIPLNSLRFDSCRSIAPFPSFSWNEIIEANIQVAPFFRKLLFIRSTRGVCIDFYKIKLVEG